MGVLSLTNCAVHIDGYDWTTDTNQMKLNVEAAALDATTFGSGGARVMAGGLKTVAFAHAGLWQSDTTAAVDPQAFSDLAVSRAHTVVPVNSETGVAYMFQASKFKYTPFDGKIGELAGFSLDSKGSDQTTGVVRGQLAAAKQVPPAAGNQLGSVCQLGAMSSTQYLYATFHAFAVGTTITVQIQSAPASNFASPTLRATIGPITAVGGTWLTRVAGPVTDQYWRFKVSAATGPSSFSVAGAIGIL